jgi:flagellar motor switch protein FliG
MTAHDERIDTLLALALTFGISAASDTTAPDVAQASGVGAARAALDSQMLSQFASLPESERQHIAAQLAHYKKLSPDTQERWLARVLIGVNADNAADQLDPHIHPTHIVKALRKEPSHIQTLILRQLPGHLADYCARTLNPAPLREKTNTAPATPSALKSGNAISSSLKSGGEFNSSKSGDSLPDTPQHQQILKIIRRSFYNRFVSAIQLSTPTPLDLLARSDLARLFHTLSVREMAIACRGEKQATNIAQIWRRFPPEDIRIFVEQIATPEEVEPHRIALAEEIIEEALSVYPDPAGALDYTGLRLLSFVMRRRGPLCVAYTLQKLPADVSDYFQSMLRHAPMGNSGTLIPMLVEEIEVLAANLHRAARKTANTDRTGVTHEH